VGGNFNSFSSYLRGEILCYNKINVRLGDKEKAFQDLLFVLEGFFIFREGRREWIGVG
jgi:hypothetical protein